MSSAPASGPEVVNDFTIPKWAGKPPSGLHLDVMKETKMIQKLMIDEKRFYFFGRNKETCDFQIDHASCSRVHAVLIWHKHLNRPFLIDLNSTHGTFIGSIRLEPNKPQQVFIDNELKFGASTRTYIIRERPQMNKNLPTSLLTNSEGGEYDENDPNSSINSYALPESEAELDNLTEFNTAHNRRIAQLVDLNTVGPNSSSMMGPTTIKRKKKIVSFNEDEEVINPEDIDPSIGRFRNMIQTSIVIPNKKRLSGVLQQEPSKMAAKKPKTEDEEDDDEDYDPSKLFAARQNSSKDEEDDENEDGFGKPAAPNLGIKVLNLAPDVDALPKEPTSVSTHAAEQQIHAQLLLNRQLQLQKQAMLNAEYAALDAHDPLDKKKKYAKEAWPGRKHQSPGSSDLNITPAVSASSPPAAARHLVAAAVSPNVLNASPTLPSTSPPIAAQQPSLPANPTKRLII